jgi:hypothetical protein
VGFEGVNLFSAGSGEKDLRLTPYYQYGKNITRSKSKNETEILFTAAETLF